MIGKFSPVRPIIGDDELDTLLRQATDEANVAAERVRLGDRDRALATLGLG
jgi:hypothetical protein